MNAIEYLPIFQFNIFQVNNFNHLKNYIVQFDRQIVI